MAVFRVEKTKDFTIMSNHHLRNTELSLKAKGLLSLMLSLPEDWDYTTKGLAHICKDGVDSITTALKELERHGYLTRQRLRYDNGQLGDIEYTIHEQPVSTENTGLSPKRENPRQVKPEQAKPKQAEPEQENPAQLNTNPLKTKKSKKDKSITYPSIYPAEPEAANRTDGMDRIELIEAYQCAGLPDPDSGIWSCGCGSCSGRWRNPTGTGLPKYGRNTGIKRAGKENIRSPLGQTLRDRCGLLFAETGDQLRSHSPVFTSRDFLRSPVSWRTGLCVCWER